jgi:FAD/FMN-containing dehydrogenase
MTMTTIDIARRDGGFVNVTPEQLDDLASRIDGSLLGRGDDDWDDAVLIWNGLVDKTPALVVQPESARDVAASVRFARENGVLLGVKGGGHNIAGTAIPEGGLMLDMSRLRSVSVDVEAKLAHVAAGCLLQDVDRATQEHGLATVLGFISEVGVGGLTLGGGLGYLTRRFGWTVDNLAGVEIITADGVIRTANRDENADLFWALRGGGGNFGVVTRYTFRLHEVGPNIYGGLIAWPFDRADEILAAYRKLSAEAPRELSVWLVLMRAPAAPFVPPEYHGERCCVMAVCYSGDPARKDAAIAPIRELGDPAVDLLQEWPYTMQQSFLDDSEPKGVHAYWKTEYLAELSEDLLPILRDLAADCPIPDAQIGLLHLGGALNDRDWDDGAVGNRDARFAVGVNGMWESGELDADACRRWIRAGWERIRPFATGGNYVNFQTDDEDQVPADAYGENFERLRRIKAEYDPDNLFRVNRNIPPAG